MARPEPSLSARDGMRRWAPLVLVGALLVAHAAVFDFVCDDAFISFRYAENLVRHGQLVFDVGERVEGYTNFGWTMLLALVVALGGDPVLWSRLLGVACALGVLVVVTRAVRERLAAAPLAEATALGAALWLALAPTFACWSTGGLETALFTLLATLGFAAAWRESEEPSAPARSGLWLGASALARPEGVLLFALTAAHRALLLLRARRAPGRGEVAFVGGFLVLVLPYELWRIRYYGWLFPNTFYVKEGGPALWAPGMRELGRFVLDHQLWAVVPLALLCARPRLLGLAALWCAGLATHVASVGGDFMELHRFLMPLLPVLALPLALGARRAAVALRARRVPAVALYLVLLALVGWRASVVDRVASDAIRERGVDPIDWLRRFSAQAQAIGVWLRVHEPAGTRIAVNAAGAIPYESRLETIDMLGVNDVWVAHHVPATSSRPGHGKHAPLEYAARRGADLVIGHPQISELPPPPPAAEAAVLPRLGYAWEVVVVPGMEPARWGFWRRIAGPRPAGN